MDGPFPGIFLKVNSGGTVNINAAGNNADIRSLILDAGSELTESITGDFILGNQAAQPNLGQLSIAEDQTFNADAGSDIRIDLAITGTGNLIFNTVGAGSDVILFDVSNLVGTVRFNGTGDMLRIVRRSGLRPRRNEWNRNQ